MHHFRFGAGSGEAAPIATTQLVGLGAPPVCLGLQLRSFWSCEKFNWRIAIRWETDQLSSLSFPVCGGMKKKKNMIHHGRRVVHIPVLENKGQRKMGSIKQGRPLTETQALDQLIQNISVPNSLPRA